MRAFFIIVISFLFFACDNPIVSFKKPCNAETAKETVMDLAEVKGKIQQLETLAGNNRTYWQQDSVQKDNKWYYRYQLVSRLPYTDVHLYTFWVAKGNCNELFVQQKDSTLLPYAQLAKQTEQQKAQQKQFPAFFKQFVANMAFRQQHISEPLWRLRIEKDGTVLLTEEELLKDNMNALQTYSFSYYPDRVCCKNTENAITLVFIPAGDTWRLSEIWQ